MLLFLLFHSLSDHSTINLVDRIAEQRNILCDVRSEDNRLSAVAQIGKEAAHMRNYDAQLAKLQIGAENYTVKSPVSGYVNVISVVSPGQMVSAGNTVCSIVPSEKALQFECYIQDKDRSDIETGMEVAINRFHSPVPEARSTAR